jgi:hypothetical protein
MKRGQPKVKADFRKQKTGNLGSKTKVGIQQERRKHDADTRVSKSREKRLEGKDM